MFLDTSHKMLTKVHLLLLLRSQEGVGNTAMNMLVKTSSITRNDQEVASQKEVMVNIMLSTASMHCSPVKPEKPADILCVILPIFAGGVISSISFWIKTKLFVLR